MYLSNPNVRRGVLSLGCLFETNKIRFFAISFFYVLPTWGSAPSRNRKLLSMAARKFQKPERLPPHESDRRPTTMSLAWSPTHG